MGINTSIEQPKKIDKIIETKEKQTKKYKYIYPLMHVIEAKKEEI